jgi:hypothetical protein
LSGVWVYLRQANCVSISNDRKGGAGGEIPIAKIALEIHKVELTPGIIIGKVIGVVALQAAAFTSALGRVRRAETSANDRGGIKNSLLVFVRKIDLNNPLLVINPVSRLPLASKNASRRPWMALEARSAMGKRGGEKSFWSRFQSDHGGYGWNSIQELS